MAKKVTITFKNPVDESYIDHLEVWWKLTVGGTYAQLGSDITFVAGTSDYSVEDTSGNVADDAVLYYEARAYNDNGGETVGTDYNKLEANITISGASAYDPSAESGIQFAILSDTALPTDVGGSNNDMITIATYGDPTNSGGLNEFNSADTDLTELTTPVTIAQDTPFTEIYEIALDVVSGLVSTTPMLSPTGVNSDWAIALRSDDNLQFTVGTQGDSTILASDKFTAGVARILTFKRDASNVITIQFDDETPITLNAGGATNNQPIIREQVGGSDNLSRFMDFKFGRWILFDEDKTGQDLIDAKQWVADGTP